MLKFQFKFKFPLLFLSYLLGFQYPGTFIFGGLGKIWNLVWIGRKLLLSVVAAPLGFVLLPSLFVLWDRIGQHFQRGSWTVFWVFPAWARFPELHPAAPTIVFADRRSTKPSSCWVLLKTWPHISVLALDIKTGHWCSVVELFCCFWPQRTCLDVLVVVLEDCKLAERSGSLIWCGNRPWKTPKDLVLLRERCICVFH